MGLKMKNHFKTQRAPGFTLLEVLVAAAVTTIIIGGSTLAMQQTFISVASLSIEGALDSKSSDVLDFCSQELKDTGNKCTTFVVGGKPTNNRSLPSGASISSGANDSITFARATGSDAAGQPTFGNKITYYVITYADPSTPNVLARDETFSDGHIETRILTDRLYKAPPGAPIPVITTVLGINNQAGYQVPLPTGADFRVTQANVMTVTLLLSQRASYLNANKYDSTLGTQVDLSTDETILLNGVQTFITVGLNSNDNVIVSVAQGAVQLLNDR